jgi:hypothetical protein
MFAALVILGLAVWRGALEKLASLFGIVYAPNSLFFIALGFIVVLLLHFSAAVSRLTDQSKVLAQRLALLEERVRDVERAPAITSDEPDDELSPLAEFERTP